ncbi:MAG: DUF1345 domain-containing protein [Steroidobacteraceae bacterium]
MHSRKVPRFVVQHSRILIAALAGIAAYLAAPPAWSEVTRVLTGWNVSALLFLLLTYLFVTRLGAEQLRSRYEGEDPTAPVILLVVTVAALLSLVAIVELLSTLKHAMPIDQGAHLALATLTVVASWLLVPTMFTLHYADMFYSARPDSRPLSFPGTAEPAFWDFAYFSFTIAAACQTADVATTTVPIRKAVIAHEIVSFVFNVSILGFAINVTAGLLGSG